MTAQQRIAAEIATLRRAERATLQRLRDTRLRLDTLASVCPECDPGDPGNGDPPPDPPVDPDP